LNAGRIAEGVEVGRRAVQLDSESFVANWVLQVALLLNGQFEASVATGESALALSGRHPWCRAGLAGALAAWGKAGDAGALSCGVQARARREYVAPTSLAIGGSAAAREDETIRYAREAYEIRDPSCTTFFSRYSRLTAARLYRVARFREIIVQMG